MNSGNIRSNSTMAAALQRLRPQRGLAFGVIIITALLAFELFNYSTTDFALNDLLGDLTFMSIRWATILSIAFCGIDFAGIARLFTPEEGENEPTEVWYLFGAWLLAATMNALLTWWGVSLAVLEHQSLGNEVVDRATLLRIVPIFVAVLVWLIRVLIIGTFSVAGDRLFSQADQRRSRNAQPRITTQPKSVRSLSPHIQAPKQPIASNQVHQPRPKPRSAATPEAGYTRNEPTYHPVMSAKSNQQQTSSRQFTKPGPSNRN